MSVEATTRPGPQPLVERFNPIEIVAHWLTFAAFLYLLGTGLAFAYPRLFWLTALFGGPQTSRILHPYAGFIFTAGLVLMTLLWVRDMLPEPADRYWWSRLKDYITLNSEGLEADTGRFNAGQKGFFWIMVIATITLLVTGLFLWQTGWSGPAVRTWMRLIHELAMLVAFGMLLIHAYMGAAMYPGTFGSMLHGQVSRGWALLHAPRWYRARYQRRQ